MVHVLSQSVPGPPPGTTCGATWAPVSPVRTLCNKDGTRIITVGIVTATRHHMWSYMGSSFPSQDALQQRWYTYYHSRYRDRHPAPHVALHGIQFPQSGRSVTEMVHILSQSVSGLPPGTTCGATWAPVSPVRALCNKDGTRIITVGIGTATRHHMWSCMGSSFPSQGALQQTWYMYYHSRFRDRHPAPHVELHGIQFPQSGRSVTKTVHVLSQSVPGPPPGTTCGATWAPVSPVRTLCNKDGTRIITVGTGTATRRHMWRYMGSSFPSQGAL